MNGTSVIRSIKRRLSLRSSRSSKGRLIDVSDNRSHSESTTLLGDSGTVSLEEHSLHNPFQPKKQQREDKVLTHEILKNMRKEASKLSTLLHKQDSNTLKPLLKLSISFIEDVLSKKLKSSHPFLATRLKSAMSEYLGLLIQLDKRKAFHRWMTSNALFKILYQYIATLYLGMESLVRENNYISDYPPLNKVNLIIKDKQGWAFWNTYFGVKRLIVRWDEFIEAWKTHFKKTSSDMENLSPFLRYSLITYSSSSVSQFGFEEFLSRFGALDEAYDRANELANQRWFFGYLSSKEADCILADEKLGSFLVRYGSSGPFALTYKSESGKDAIVKHAIIDYTVGLGYSIEEYSEVDGNKESSDRYFLTLPLLVAYYRSFLLTKGCTSDLVRKTWFFGDITSSEASLLLHLKQDGAYLLRHSQSNKGSIVVSYKGNGTIHHTLINKLGSVNGYLCEGELYPDIDTFLKKHRLAFVHPICRLTLSTQTSVISSKGVTVTEHDSNSDASTMYEFMGQRPPVIPTPTTAVNNHSQVSRAGDVDKLVSMGFTLADCIEAVSNTDTFEAALANLLNP